MSNFLANIFKIKRRTTNGDAPVSLQNGELAYNEVSNKLYYGMNDGSVKEIGGQGALMTLSTSQTITEAKTFTGNVDLGSSATVSTQTRTTSSTSIANTAFVQDVASLLDGGSF
jgi:hypothetical protein